VKQCHLMEPGMGSVQTYNRLEESHNDFFTKNS